MAITSPNPNGAYSFADVQVTFSYPGGSTVISPSTQNTADIGQGGFADEGIRITRTKDKNVMTSGADGGVMHSLVVAKTGRLTITLQKTAPLNAVLSQLYNEQSINSALWGQNQIVINELATGDSVTCSTVAFLKEPDTAYRTEGGVMEWDFDCGQVDMVLGNGLNPTGVIAAA